MFDATNYAQNLLQAARALEQINHQIQSLQNEAAMLQNMARNLERHRLPAARAGQSAMQRIDQLMGQAQGIDFRVDRLDQRLRSHVPGRGRPRAEARPARRLRRGRGSTPRWPATARRWACRRRSSRMSARMPGCSPSWSGAARARSAACRRSRRPTSCSRSASSSSSSSRI